MSMRKNIIIAAVLALVVWALPVEAFAAGGGSVEQCAPGHDQWQFTVKIVDCVRKTVKSSVNEMMNAISAYMAPVAGALATLAIAAFGMRMMGGEEGVHTKTPMFVVRIAVVAFFANNLGGYASTVFDVQSELEDIMSGGDPWEKLDEIVGILLGVGPPPLDISKGFMGIIGAGLLSSTPVGIMAFVAMSAIINTLMFVYRVVFTYLLALVTIGFLLVVSPLVIPFAVFVTHGERFFTKWLDILISAIITPALLLTFVSVFITGIKEMADDAIHTLQCGVESSGNCNVDPGSLNFKAYQKTNDPRLSWGVLTDNTYARQLGEKAGKGDTPGIPMVQPNVTPNWRGLAQTASVVTQPRVDFGPDTIKMVRELIFSFLAIWVYASFMKSLVERVPDLASNISEAASYISMTPSAGEHKIESGLRSLQTAVTGRK